MLSSFLPKYTVNSKIGHELLSMESNKIQASKSSFGVTSEQKGYCLHNITSSQAV